MKQVPLENLVRQETKKPSNAISKFFRKNEKECGVNKYNFVCIVLYLFKPLMKPNFPKSEIHYSPLSNDTESDESKGKVISEEEKLKRILAHDPKEGVELLFRRYYANLCNHAIRFVFSREIAEEIVSEVFANFWQGRAYEKQIDSYTAYLYKAVRNRSYNYLKHELNRSAPLDNVSTVPDQYPGPEEVLRYNDLSHKIDYLIQGLPTRCRQAFLLNRIEGMKYSEVAIEMKITASAVERLISRALTKLRQELKEDW